VSGQRWARTTSIRVLVSEGSSLLAGEAIPALGSAGCHIEVCAPSELCLGRFSRPLESARRIEQELDRDFREAREGTNMSSELVPFQLRIDDAQIQDLRARLARTRWPERETVEDWSQGIPLSYVQELCSYWERDYDMRRLEARLNAHPQFRMTIDGVGIHFLHVRSRHDGALPLVMTHGWPGSVLEFLHVIEPLTNPADPRDAFHLVLPSIPGYGFSDKPARPGWGVEQVARAWAQLMARLDYQRYGAQGGDWGSAITLALGQQDAAHLAGIHVNLAFADPAALAAFGDLTEFEQAGLAALRNYMENESGYSTQQSTRPQTLGYGLADSPAGQAAWIVEKFKAWGDCDGPPGERVPPRRAARQCDDVLADEQRDVLGSALLAELQERAVRVLAGRGPFRLFGLQGHSRPVGAVGAHALHRPALLQQARPRRALRGARAAAGIRDRGAGGVSGDAVGPRRSLAILAHREALAALASR
jgi:pimeloyl-ACP methyl ester carboxylesterase